MVWSNGRQSLSFSITIWPSSHKWFGVVGQRVMRGREETKWQSQKRALSLTTWVFWPLIRLQRLMAENLESHWLKGEICPRIQVPSKKTFSHWECPTQFLLGLLWPCSDWDLLIPGMLLISFVAFHISFISIQWLSLYFSCRRFWCSGIAETGQGLESYLRRLRTC